MNEVKSMDIDNIPKQLVHSDSGLTFSWIFNNQTFNILLSKSAVSNPIHSFFFISCNTDYEI